MEATDAELLLRIGCRISEIRRENGQTQEQLAAAYPCSPRYVQVVEQGQKNVSVLVLARFARVLDVPLEALFVRPRTLARNPGRPKKST